MSLTNVSLKFKKPTNVSAQINMNWTQLYSGYLKTPLLWEGTLDGLTQLELPEIKTPAFSGKPPNSMRLGHIAEQFTFEYWSHVEGLKLHAHNLQIEGDNRTLGEIDAILEFEKNFLHVEIAYKFYLYDPTVGVSILDRWIGPNRKDSFVTKLSRLREQQLPLLDSSEAKEVLNTLVPESEVLKSKVWIKGQLFVPHGLELDVAPLNQACVVGTYLKKEALSHFEGARFFLPTKQEWMSSPHTAVDWCDLVTLEAKIAPLLDNHFSPLLWVKTENGILQKMMVIWW